MISILSEPNGLIVVGILFDLIGAVILAPGFVAKAKRAIDMYKLLRTEGYEPSAASVNMYLRDIDEEPRRLGTPEEELRRFSKEYVPIAIGLSFLIVGYIFQLMGSYLQLTG